MPTIEFSIIDAKDSGPVEICAKKGENYNDYYGRACNEKNAMIMAEATAEYLNSLLDLQSQIKDTYESLLIENTLVKGEDEDEVDSIGYERYKSFIKPGADNLYYT